jgi:hypothetical protein
MVAFRVIDPRVAHSTRAVEALLNGSVEPDKLRGEMAS